MAETRKAPAEMTDLSASTGGRARKISLDPMRNYAVLVTLLILIAVLALTSGSFRTATNVENVLSQCAIVGIMASGVAVVFIAGEFDLSIGAVYSVAALIAALAQPVLGGVGALIAGVGAAAAIGVVNGLLVTRGRINAFMTTLATSFLIGGLAVILTAGAPIAITEGFLLGLGQNHVLGLNVPVYVWVGFVIVLSILLLLTKFGRRLYATGGSAEAARLSGVNVVFTKTVAFAVSAGAAGLAGIIAAGAVGSADPNAGTNLVLTPIAAAVVGGISIYGGSGAIWRASAGVLLLVLINNGFDLLGINALYSQVVQGAVILIAVAIDAWTRKSRT